jgi:hypothetical protein
MHVTLLSFCLLTEISSFIEGCEKQDQLHGDGAVEFRFDKD